LQYLAPGDGQHGIGPVTAAGRETLSPVEIGHSPLVYIVGFIDIEQFFRFWGDLSDKDAGQGTESDQLCLNCDLQGVLKGLWSGWGKLILL